MPEDSKRDKESAAKAKAKAKEKPEPTRADKASQAAKTYASTESRSKPSATKRAAGRAVTGAGTGAALGSIVPGVGTATGAAVGAAVGGLSGAASAQREKRAQAGPARRALVAEFLLCIVILALSPLSMKEGQQPNARDWMRRGSAMCAVFLGLGMVSSIGPRAARAAVALGGLITLVVVIDQRSIFATLAEKFNAGKATGRADRLLTSPPDEEEAGPGSDSRPPERYVR